MGDSNAFGARYSISGLWRQDLWMESQLWRWCKWHKHILLWLLSVDHQPTSRHYTRSLLYMFLNKVPMSEKNEGETCNGMKTIIKKSHFVTIGRLYEHMWMNKNANPKIRFSCTFLTISLPWSCDSTGKWKVELQLGSWHGVTNESCNPAAKPCAVLLSAQI